MPYLDSKRHIPTPPTERNQLKAILLIKVAYGNSVVRTNE